MPKTIKEINSKIARGEAVVVTAEEMIGIVKSEGRKKAAERVDVVTTGTFGPMCSSGMYMNPGHSKPRIKIGGGTFYLNGVPVYTGFAAMDIILGATALPEDDPRNRVHPGEFLYGGGHVIEEFVAGKDIKLTGTAYGTDCYPGKRLETWINIRDVNEAVLFNPRNAYQNYNVAVNVSDRIIYTYMGVLKPDLGNANYCSAGQLSPLLNDPFYRTIGVGTRIFLGGGTGYIAWHGTQHNPGSPRKKNGVPCAGAGTLAVMGDLKRMNPRWLVGTSMLGYGVTLTVGIGIPIPVLDEEMAGFTGVSDEEIFAPVVDYGEAYPQMKAGNLGEVSYAELKQGKIRLKGREVMTASLSSYPRAVEIAETLREWIQKKKFFLSERVAELPSADSGYACRPMKIRGIRP